jgi:hypothetical protein
MNWFTQFFQAQLAQSGWLSQLSLSLPIQFLFFSILLGLSLLKKRELKTSVFTISVVATAALIFFDPQPTLEFLKTGSRLDGITLDTFLVAFAMILGPILIVICLRKKTRTIDRLMIAILLTASSYLMFGYHILLINGLLRFNLQQQEIHLVDVAKLNNAAFIDSCRALNLDCRTGPQTDNLEYSINDELKRQANDFLQFYRKQGKEPLLFSDSNALISKKYPYAYAYIETGKQFRWVIDTTAPKAISLAYQTAYALVCHVIIIFWTLAMLLALYLHHVMFFLRREKILLKAQKDAEQAILNQFKKT